jgi:hypothetical protein
MQENPNLQAHLLAEIFSMDLDMAKKLLNNPNRFLVHEFCSEPLEFYSDPLQWWDLRLEKVNMQGTQNLKSYLLVGRKLFHGFGHDNKALEQ